MISSRRGLLVAYLGSRAEWNLIILEKHKLIGLNQIVAPERQYKTGSVTRWNNERDGVDTIPKKKRRKEGEVKSAGRSEKRTK